VRGATASTKDAVADWRSLSVRPVHKHRYRFGDDPAAERHHRISHRYGAHKIANVIASVETVPEMEAIAPSHMEGPADSAHLVARLRTSSGER
jgi:hypothetical protein